MIRVRFYYNETDEFEFRKATNNDHNMNQQFEYIFATAEQLYNYVDNNKIEIYLVDNKTGKRIPELRKNPIYRDFTKENFAQFVLEFT